MLADAALDSSCTVLVGRPQLASPTRQRVASMQKMLPAICADTCWLGPVHAIFERCVALEKVTRQGTSRHQEQTLVGAWSKSFRVCASATNGQDRNAHHSRTVRLAKGATRSMAIGCLARRIAAAKGSICRVANARRAGSVFVSCLAPCSYCFCKDNGHDARTLNRL